MSGTTIVGARRRRDKTREYYAQWEIGPGAFGGARSDGAAGRAAAGRGSNGIIRASRRRVVPMRASRTVLCACGESFFTEVYTSINVTTAPELRERVERGELNAVACPACGRVQRAPVPFLYHDMARSVRIWVYPEGERPNEEAILAKIRRAHAIAYSIVPADASERARHGPELVFGLDELRAALAHLS